MIRIDFREPDSRRYIFTFMHREILLAVEQHDRVAPLANRVSGWSGHDALQLDRDPRRCGAVAISLHCPEQGVGRRQLDDALRSHIQTRFGARGQPDPCPVCEDKTQQQQAEQQHRGDQSGLRQAGALFVGDLTGHARSIAT